VPEIEWQLSLGQMQFQGYKTGSHRGKYIDLEKRGSEQEKEHVRLEMSREKDGISHLL